MFNYNKKNINYEYPLPNELFINFLTGKKELDSSNYFNDLIRLIKEYDSLSTGSDHVNFYEFNYSFFLKLLTKIKERLQIVFDRNSKFLLFKEEISHLIEQEQIANLELVKEGSFFYKSIGGITANNKNILLIYDSINELYKNYYDSSSHELKPETFEKEIIRIKKMISTSSSYLNKINSELDKLGENIHKLLVVCIKGKVLKIKNEIYKNFDDLINHKDTSNPNESIALSTYRDNFNEDIRKIVTRMVLDFKETIKNYIAILPDMICYKGNFSTSKSILISFDDHMQGIVDVSSQTDYFKNFKNYYNKTHAA